MNDLSVPQTHWSDAWRGRYLRVAAGGWVPARWYQKSLPACRPVSGRLKLEIVSHCWNYAHLLIHQLSSLVNAPPTRIEVTMTVFYNREDTRTARLLDFFAGQQVANVHWNWRELPKPALFRRAIGRNLAALETRADWVWFTDCDLMFMAGCLDNLAAQLQGRTDRLVYPRIERCTSLLADDDPLMSADTDRPAVLAIKTDKFEEFQRTRATGPLQITHGDIARAAGYCAGIAYYQQPSAVWCKAYEDRAFRWLLRTQGTPLDIPGVYRIRHIHKGRYTGSHTQSKMRGSLRRLTSWWKEQRRRRQKPGG